MLDERVLHMHFITQVLACFAVIFATMVVMTLVNPLAAPRVLPVREDMDLKTEPVVKVAGCLVIAGVIAFFIIFR